MLAFSLPAEAQTRLPYVGGGLERTGVLDSRDLMEADGSYYEDYAYAASPGETLVIDLMSDDFDAWLVVGRMAGGEFESIESDDDGGAGTNSRITYTFPSADDFVIRANTLSGGDTGAYRLVLSPSRGGVPVVAGGIGIASGQTLTGTLAAGDAVADDDTFYDAYSYNAAAGERVVIDLISSDFDAYLRVGEMSGGELQLLGSNDDNDDGGTNSTIIYTFESAGTYTIHANSLSPATGSYALTVRSLNR
jgi:hypothetical protein